MRFSAPLWQRARKRQRRSHSKTSPVTDQGRLAKRVPLDSFSFMEKVTGGQMRVTPAEKNEAST